MMDNKIFILTFIAVVFVFGGLLYIYNPGPTEYKNPNEKEPVACTIEAKLCPDGSYVSREGPNCEFALCPTASSTEQNGTSASTSSQQIQQ